MPVIPFALPRAFGTLVGDHHHGCAIVTVTVAFPGEQAAMLNPGAHGFSEVLYALASSANNNGSAFAGLSADTVWYITVLGVVMLLGRFLPMVFVLALSDAAGPGSRGLRRVRG